MLEQEGHRLVGGGERRGRGEAVAGSATGRSDDRVGHDRPGRVEPAQVGLDRQQAREVGLAPARPGPLADDRVDQRDGRRPVGDRAEAGAAADPPAVDRVDRRGAPDRLPGGLAAADLALDRCVVTGDVPAPDAPGSGPRVRARRSGRGSDG